MTDVGCSCPRTDARDCMVARSRKLDPQGFVELFGEEPPPPYDPEEVCDCDCHEPPSCNCDEHPDGGCQRTAWFEARRTTP